MEKQPSSWRGSNGGHEERLPLRCGGGGGLETEARAPHAHAHAADQQEAGRGRHRRNCVRAALVLCLLTLPACVLVVGNLRAESSSEMLFDVDLPKYDGDDQGTATHSTSNSYYLTVEAEADRCCPDRMDRHRTCTY